MICGLDILLFIVLMIFGDFINCCIKVWIVLGIVVENNIVWCCIVGILFIINFILLMNFIFIILLVLFKIKVWILFVFNVWWFKWLIICLGVLIMICGFFFKVLIWCLIGILLNIVIIWIFCLWLNFFNCLVICIVNFFVGVKINDWIFCFFIIFLIKGILNVFVLFVLVWVCLRILIFCNV